VRFSFSPVGHREHREAPERGVVRARPTNLEWAFESLVLRHFTPELRYFPREAPFFALPSAYIEDCPIAAWQTLGHGDRLFHAARLPINCLMLARTGC